MPQASYLSYRATHRFSALALDYLDHKEVLVPFLEFLPNEAGIAAALVARKQYPVNRAALVQVLQEQYAGLPAAPKVQANIQALLQANTFSVCTAHQPNLGTGYLYFVFKILHAIKLADSLNSQYPDCHFVPVYYIGSEDADLEELGTFRFGEEQFVWDGGGQQGAVGRMDTASLAPLLKNLFARFGPPGANLDALQEMLEASYLKQPTIAKATQYLVHRLFGDYGLVVLDPDAALLKRQYIPVMQEELLHQTSLPLAQERIRQMEQAGYSSQAFPREINLFYLAPNLRARIEKQGSVWQVLGTSVSWSEAELMEELNEHPERFSPNVILRPGYQESILPNIAFIGGGAELAYWLQLKQVFAHHKIFFPAIFLRQSLGLLTAKNVELFSKLGMTWEEVFAPATETQRAYVSRHATEDFALQAERNDLRALLQAMALKAANIDLSLAGSAQAALAKMNHQVDTLERKMYRAEKRKFQIAFDRLSRLQNSLFPGGGLQERVENFMPYYLESGSAFFDGILDLIQPFHNRFIVMNT